VTPRPLSEISKDIELTGKLLDKIDYIQLGARLPGLIEELSAVFRGTMPDLLRDRCLPHRPEIHRPGPPRLRRTHQRHRIRPGHHRIDAPARRHHGSQGTRPPQ
jgi:hypothetical protein